MALREILAKFGFEVDSKNLKDADDKTKGLAGKLKAVAGAFAAGAIVGKFKDFVAELKETAGNIKRTAALMGVSVEEAQRWTSAATLAGVSAESLATGVKFLQKNMVAAAEGGGDAAAVFQSLGVKVKDAAGNLKPTAQVLGDVGLEIAAMQDPAKRTAATLKVFGKQGLELLPLFSKGEKGLQEFLDKVDELGGGISQDAIQALKDNSRASKEYDLALLGLKSRLVSQLLPAFTSFIKWGTKTVVNFSDMAKKSNVFKAAAIVMGIVAVAWAASIYAAWLPLMAGIAILVLLVDDLTTAFEGGDSAIVPFLKKIFGKGAGQTVFANASKDIDDFKKRLDEIDKKGGGIGDKVVEGFSTLGGTLVKFFADDIPEALGFLWKDIKSGLAGVWKSITDDLKMEWGVIVTQVPALVKSLIDGLVQGIEDGAQWVVDAFKNLGTKAFDAIRNVFKSHSPSVALFDFAKDDLAIGGLAGGLKAGQPEVNKAMSGMYSVPQGGRGGGPVYVTQTNHNDIDIHAGSDGTSIANQVRDGQSRAHNDDRRALLAALEPVGVS